MAAVLTYTLLGVKIILIIVSVIFLVLLLLITALLFVPIRYNITGKYPNEVDGSVAEMNLQWFLSAIKYQVVFQDGNVKYVFKVFGIDIENIKGINANKSGINKKVKKDNSGKNYAKDVVAKNVEENDDSTNIIDLTRQHKPLLNRDNNHKEPIDPKKELLMSREKSLDEGLCAKNNKCGYIYYLDELKKYYRKFKWNLKNICDIIKRICNVKDKLETIFAQWIHRQTICNIKIELIRILHKIKPKFIKLHGKFGFEDPANTGKVSAIAAMLIPVFAESDFVIEPDFENSILEIDGQIDGKLRLVHILVLIIRIFKDKGNRYTFKILRRVKW